MFVSSDRSSYSDSVLVEMLNISANIYVELTRNAYMKGDEIKSPNFGFK